MPQFKPFKGIRPTEAVAQQFVTTSIDRYSTEEIEKYIQQTPHSFLQIIQPTFDSETTDSKKRFEKVRTTFDDYLEEKILVQDKSSFYVYQVVHPSGRQTKGLLGLVNIDDYRNNTIKKHEETLNHRVELFANYLKGANFHAEPVLLTYPPVQRVDLLMNAEMNKTPVLKIEDTDGVQHLLWRIDNRLTIRQIKESIERMPNLYIADGHHRMESSDSYTTHATALETEEVYGDEAFNYTLAMLVSNEELIINDYNRVIKDLNGLTTEEFLTKLEEYFDILPKGEEAFLPTKKHHLLMYLDQKFYSLYAKASQCTIQGLCELDTFIFEENLLKPILNIHDTRNDERVNFVYGTSCKEGIEELKNTVDTKDYVAGFAFYPVNVEDLQLIADLGLKMPPKSTYIEPKPLSGFAIYDLKE